MKESKDRVSMLKIVRAPGKTVIAPSARRADCKPGQRGTKHDLEGALAKVLSADSDVVSLERVTAFSVVGGWQRDIGRFGFLVQRSEGSRVLTMSMAARILTGDPALAGHRTRIEWECNALGATLEIWTEEEIEASSTRSRLIRPARGAERLAYGELSESEPPAGKKPDDFGSLSFPALASRSFDIQLIYPYEKGWIGRSSRTGIPMAILCDLEIEAQRRILNIGNTPSPRCL